MIRLFKGRKGLCYSCFLNSIRNFVPLLLSRVMVPSSCSTRLVTSCIPRVAVFLKSTSFGKPIPVSLTVSMRLSVLDGVMETVMVPSLCFGKACFKAFVTSSLMINPQGMAVVIVQKISGRYSS